ncbi:hypothetical protein RJ639_019997 [Escallonia herrerae]|uniref:RNA-dependent RNA polymerase n=1 Tax=Escallonia herrerae TaxID=1293975 RepID=A0AA89AHR9_9ASTE|nr:hypothetical protein RJ639_019997 [Escallonia herrerae]
MGKTLHLSSFPSHESAVTIKTFLENYTGKGTVYALEVFKCKYGIGAYAKKLHLTHEGNGVMALSEIQKEKGEGRLLEIIEMKPPFLSMIELTGASRIYECHINTQSYFKEIPDDQCVRATDFSPSHSIGQSSALYLEIPHGVNIPKFLDISAESKESHGCVPGLALDEEFFKLVDPEGTDVVLVEHALERLFHSTDYCYGNGQGLIAADIRAWMGDFHQIRNVAKYVARLGESFNDDGVDAGVVEVELRGDHPPALFLIRTLGRLCCSGVVVVDGDFGVAWWQEVGSGQLRLPVVLRQSCVVMGVKVSMEAVRTAEHYLYAIGRGAWTNSDNDEGELTDLVWAYFDLPKERMACVKVMGQEEESLQETSAISSTFYEKAPCRNTLGLYPDLSTSTADQDACLLIIEPHPNECSGSDLDGDIYFVCWDHDLIPPKQIQPMDYAPAPSMQLDHDVTIEEVEEYFTNYIVNDSLGIIANAHTVFADREHGKAMSTPCIELAKLFSIAVDFPKTGVPAEIPSHLRVKEYPDFMDKSDRTTYESQCVIGKLFREVKDIAPRTSSIKSFRREVARHSYDPDMEVDDFQDYLDHAFDPKSLYDYKLGNLMDYYGIKTDAEILNGSIMKMSKSFDRRKDAEAIGLAVRSLRKEARSWFNERAEELGSGADDVYAKASAWYHVTYHPSYWGCYDDGMKRAHFLSFPWCVYDKLIQIKRDKFSIKRALRMSSLERQFSCGLTLRYVITLRTSKTMLLL